jgi:hypothetical protein
MKELQPYLRPKKGTQARHTTWFEAPAEQANEHHEKQDYVGTKRDNDVECVDSCVGHDAGVC